MTPLTIALGLATPTSLTYGNRNTAWRHLGTYRRCRSSGKILPPRTGSLSRPTAGTDRMTARSCETPARWPRMTRRAPSARATRRLPPPEVFRIREDSNSEHVNVHLVAHWAYSPWMPTVAGIGLVPLLQWIVIPVLSILYVRRRHRQQGWKGCALMLHADT